MRTSSRAASSVTPASELTDVNQAVRVRSEEPLKDSLVPPHRSVGVRLFLVQSLIVASLFIPAGALFIVFEKEQQMASLHLRASSLSHLLAYEMGSRLVSGQRMQIREVERAAARDEDLAYVVLFSEAGDLLMAHGIPIVEEVGEGWLVAAANDEAPRWRIQRGATDPDGVIDRVEDIVQVTVPIEQGSVKATLVTGFSMQTIDRDAAVAGAAVICLIILTLLIFFIASYVIVFRAVTQPVMKLLVGTTAIATGNLEYRIQHEADDELGRLAVDFNQMAEALRRSSEAQRTFFSAITHELRSPLNSMIGFAELVCEMEPSLSELGRKNLDRITLAGRRLLNLINDLLDLAKLEAAKMEMRPTAFDVLPLLEEMRDQASILVGERNIEVRLEAEKGLGQMVSDRDRMAQILTNLLSNAIKFTPEGEVTLRAHRSGAQHVFEVQDTGIGIPRELHQSVFESFRQAGHAGNRRGGTGLGLAIVRQLMGLLGGVVELESEEGRGTLFRVTFPTEAPRP